MGESGVPRFASESPGHIPMTTREFLFFFFRDVLLVAKGVSAGCTSVNIAG